MKIQLSGNGQGMLMPKRIIFPAFIFLFISVFTSCKKDATPVTNTTDNSATARLSAQSGSNAVTAGTNFGALLSGSTDIDDEIDVCEKLGVNYVRYAIILKDFTGVDKGYEKWTDAGYKVLLNLNYDNVSNNNGKKTPVPFPTNMTEYRNLLEKVLDKYHPEIAVIENEPTTDVFHSGPIENYITMLKVAVDVCNQRGINVADGALHVDYVEQVMNGVIRDGNMTETQKLIDAYKTMALTYVNTHVAAPFRNSSSSKYPTGHLEEIADYLRTETGKPVICNEYNQQNTSATLMTTTVGGFENADFKYVIARSGSGDDKGATLNKGTSLTPLGITYRDAIK